MTVVFFLHAGQVPSFAGETSMKQCGQLMIIRAEWRLGAPGGHPSLSANRTHDTEELASKLPAHG